MHEILAETEKRGMTFDHLLTIPEQDEWVYSDGKSTTCVAFILEMYKEAGIFGPISKSIQVTEFTVSTYKPDYSIIEINAFQLLLTVEQRRRVCFLLHSGILLRKRNLHCPCIYMLVLVFPVN